MKRSNHRSYSVATLLVAAFLATTSVAAGDLKIKIPVPPLPPVPKIVLPAPPPMIWLPGPKVYVANDSPYEIFYRDGQYYFFHNNVWYVGHAYNGPWRQIHSHYVPSGLRHYRHENWGRYQNEAAQHFRDERYRHERYPFYAGRPHERAHWKDDRHDRGQHRGYEKQDRRDKKDKHDRGRGHDRD